MADALQDRGQVLGLIHLLKKYLLVTCYVPVTGLRVAGTFVGKRDGVFPPVLTLGIGLLKQLVSMLHCMERGVRALRQAGRTASEGRVTHGRVWSQTA